MNLDDPKLTAYALGELTGDERAAVEAAIAADPEAQRFVDETAAFGSLLKSSFAKETVLPLEECERDAVLAKAKTVPFSFRNVARVAGLSSLAAALALLPFVPMLITPEISNTSVATTSPSIPPEPNNGPALDMAVQGSIPMPPAAPEKRAFYATGNGEYLPTNTVGNVSAKGSINPSSAATPAPAALADVRLTLRENIGDTRKSKSQISISSDNRDSDAITRTEPVDGRASGVASAALSSNPQPAAQPRQIDMSSGLWAGNMPSAQPLRISRHEHEASLLKRAAKSNSDTRSRFALDGSKASPETQHPNTEAYAQTPESGFLTVAQSPLSTFSIDVDTASYSNIRRMLNNGQRPPADAVRIEEFINYFTYDYPEPKGDAPFSTTLEVAECPWKPEHRLVRIGLKGRVVPADKRPAANLVFLIDVSGSMLRHDKLPLLKESLRLLVDQLGPKDRVGIVVYAGAAGLVLPPTGVDEKATILKALDGLTAGGSTNGGQGIQLAYQIAEEMKVPGSINRVILASDGDFNVGMTSHEALTQLIEEKAKSKIFLTVLGFGTGNLKDATMEKLANRGNGNYAYIDSLREGRKVLVEQMSGTLQTIAKDVKIQVEFNPAIVGSYRLVGYENRMLAKEDFNDDKKDAGEIGAGHTVTALYEVVPAALGEPGVAPLKYQKAPTPQKTSDEMLTLKLRYKEPEGDKSRLIEEPLKDAGRNWAQSSRDFRFAAAVAEFGMLLRGSPYAGSANWESVKELAIEGKGDDQAGYREEFLQLVEKASLLR